MYITKVEAKYSKSINTKNYGKPESWIGIEARYEAVCESADDPAKVYQALYAQAKDDVVKATQAIVDKMKGVAPAANAPTNTGAAPATEAANTAGPRTL
jgi:hypothetical protein